MSTPYSNKPKITQIDITNGYVTRYFVYNISTKLTTEVDKKQYEIFKTNTLYETLELPWVIAGFANNIVAKDGKIIYGVNHQNQITVNWYNKKISGLDRILKDKLEYFQGVDNKSE